MYALSSGNLLSVSGRDWLLSLTTSSHCHSSAPCQNNGISPESFTGECFWFQLHALTLLQCWRQFSLTQILSVTFKLTSQRTRRSGMKTGLNHQVGMLSRLPLVLANCSSFLKLEGGKITPPPPTPPVLFSFFIFS